jgi:AcrR family transcriptional regulator
MAGKRRNAQERKPEILENFYAVLTEEGLEGASLAKIAARMGIHHSLIIHYFSTKEELVVELVEYILEKYENTFLPMLSEIEDPGERLEKTVDAVFGLDWTKLVDSGVFYACYSLSFRNERVRDSFQKLYSRLREVLVDEITEYMEKKIIVRGDPAKLADLIISLLAGYDFYRSVIEDEGQIEELALFLKQNALSLLKVNEG